MKITIQKIIIAKMIVTFMVVALVFIDGYSFIWVAFLLISYIIELMLCLVLKDMDFYSGEGNEWTRKAPINYKP